MSSTRKPRTFDEAMEQARVRRGLPKRETEDRHTAITAADREHAVRVAQEIVAHETGAGVTHRSVDSREAYLLAMTLEYAMRLIGRMTIDEGRLAEQIDEARAERDTAHARIAYLESELERIRPVYEAACAVKDRESEYTAAQATRPNSNRSWQDAIDDARYAVNDAVRAMCAAVDRARSPR